MIDQFSLKFCSANYIFNLSIWRCYTGQRSGKQAQAKREYVGQESDHLHHFYENISAF